MMRLSAEIREELEVACLDAMGGDPPGPLLASRLERACKGVLTRNGLGSAQVKCTSNYQGTSVQLLLPKPDQTVQSIVLTLG